MKIIFFETNEKEGKLLRDFFGEQIGAEVVFYEAKLTRDNLALAQEAEIISIFVDSVIDKEMIDNLPKLKYLATRSTGFDHIDINYAKEKGITLSNVPGYGSHTVAEFVFGLLLNLTRKIFKARHQILEGCSFDLENLGGTELFGKTISVIGTGRIGKNVVKIAKGFGMKVLGCDLYPDNNFATENDFSYVPLNEALVGADIITLHVPYTKENHHLINQENIGLIKEGSFLINTARGELVETSALVEALNSGKIAGAGLDVIECEREIKVENELIKKKTQIADYRTLYENHLLMDRENVLITPHMAFFTKEAETEILKITAENINGFIGGEVKNLV